MGKFSQAFALLCYKTMKKLLLTQGKSASVDDAYYPLLAKYKWHLAKRNKTEYAETQICGNHIMMHRLIAGNIGFNEIDHKDGDGLNNQESNLRIVNKVWNGCNRGMNKNNTSGYKGVQEMKDHWRERPFLARICFMKKWYKLGYFKTAKEAALAYNEGAKKYHKEFAYQNKINL